MALNVLSKEREINPDEKHNVKLKFSPLFFSESNTNRYVKPKSICLICGETEETEICNRTIYS